MQEPVLRLVETRHLAGPFKADFTIVSRIGPPSDRRWPTVDSAATLPRGDLALGTRDIRLADVDSRVHGVSVTLAPVGPSFGSKKWRQRKSAPTRSTSSGVYGGSSTWVPSVLRGEVGNGSMTTRSGGAKFEWRMTTELNNDQIPIAGR